MMTDKEKSNMEALEAKEKKLKEEMSEIENQKQAIKAKEEQRIDAERFHSLVALLDAGDAILSATKHTRTSCSDDNVCNGHTTPGRGGNVRCTKCALIEAVEDWKNNRHWLIDVKSAKQIEDYLGFYDISLEIDIKTRSED